VIAFQRSAEQMRPLLHALFHRLQYVLGRLALYARAGGQLCEDDCVNSSEEVQSPRLRFFLGVRAGVPKSIATQRQRQLRAFCCPPR
jgi:hypothetical protein